MTGNVSSLFRQQQALWRLLYRPMLVISLVLHGAVLAVRLPTEPPPPPEPAPSPSPTLSRITSLTPPAPKPKVTSKPKPQPSGSRSVSASGSTIAPASPKPQPSPIATQPSAAPTPTPASPEPLTPKASPAASLAELETGGPAEAVDEFLGQLQQGISQVDAVEGQGIPYFLFEQPEQFFTAESLQASETTGQAPTPLAGIEDILWASRQRPEQIYASLQNQFAGFTFTEQPEYGGGTLYAVQKGNTTRYISLVRARDKTATFVVIWKQNPHQPTVAAN
ncbi:hypothetical protein OOK60_12870 [Trichothermofontia sichuanensis B231]|uniref:hypothetical protein n=1 Tax=Trichothermofontia sichuanensis TaxID=3045816 RepID=UPI0022461A13|nr:hypothetical protein [Trichothermofontia sichuanensis]UZQ53391.1 hypothetical protein OOK60_12870 [Trichothermofontia sichuanensis B231]